MKVHAKWSEDTQFSADLEVDAEAFAADPKEAVLEAIMGLSADQFIEALSGVRDRLVTEINDAPPLTTLVTFCGRCDLQITGKVPGSEWKDEDGKLHCESGEPHVLLCEMEGNGHRPDDMPIPGDRCKDCGRNIYWEGPSQYDWVLSDM